MKRRYLNKTIEKVLTLVTGGEIMLLAMLNDFDVCWQTALMLVIWIGSIALNVYILKKWGRGVI